MGVDVAIRFNVNGRERTATTDPERSLLEVLREDLGLLGTKYGCGEGQCGACSVLLEGKRVFSCRLPAERVEGKSVVTIEGLAQGDALHPVQQAFLDEGAFQCGFCTAGMIIAAVALLAEKPKPTDAQIVAGMNRNICRCCSYPKIIQAVRRADDRKGG
ncbi:MAG: (2Fe-2S)-binding protein [Paludisphaera borealis]|uniref:(2Fe-2S)-binding protein n=1 Tax=Paludisphaera borealis TaxID=1387353 RepID=UPI00283CA602|nr:2Fe-2S iron-sulfur cluster-binding protein [Paludisphaera borealis]MDR3623176.1 (2Fe-2S)-binding protein [Paludisphaera borealis]